MSVASWEQMADGLVQDPVMQGLADEQLDAIIDVLTLTIHADSKVSPLEVAGFNHLFFDLTWVGDRHEHIRDYVPSAVEKAAVAGDEAKGRAHLDAAAAHLESPALRERVFLMAASLAGVDKNVNPAERRALKWVAKAFDLADERRREILEEAKY